MTARFTVSCTIFIDAGIVFHSTAVSFVTSALAIAPYFVDGTRGIHNTAVVLNTFTSSQVTSVAGIALTTRIAFAAIARVVVAYRIAIEVAATKGFGTVTFTLSVMFISSALLPDMIFTMSYAFTRCMIPCVARNTFASWFTYFRA